MRLLFLIAILAVCSYASLSVQSYESNLQSTNASAPRVQFANNSQSNINGFIAYYYFTSAEPNPVFEPYFMNGGIGSIEHINGVNYRVKLDFSSTSMLAGSVFPENSGISFGLHYASWDNWTKEDDYSNNMSQAMANNSKIVVTRTNGQTLAGVYPDFSINSPSVPQGNFMARVYALKEGEDNFAKIRLYVKNEGSVALNHFDFSVEVTAENGQTPVFNAWHLPNTTYTVEQKNATTWIFNFSTIGIALEPNSVFPSNNGMSFGINYANWSNVNTQNDYSLRELQNQFSLAAQIPLYINGRLVSGAPRIHDISDINKILISESEFTQSDFNRSAENLLADIPKGDKNDFWGNTDIFFKDVPNYDSTQQAVEQIFAKFPGLDTLTLVSLWKDIKASYEQLVRLRMHKRYALNVPYINRMMSITSKSYFSCEAYVDYTPLASFATFMAILFNPMRYTGSDRAKNLAYEWTSEYISMSVKKEGDEYKNLSTGYQNRADGFRHAVLNALLCRETGTQDDDINDCLEWAKLLSDLHEARTDFANDACYNELDTPMDLHNNDRGREHYRPHLRVGCEWRIPVLGLCINHEVVGPSREDTKKMFFELADKGHSFNKLNQLNVSPWAFSVVFFRSDKDPNKLYCREGEKPETDNCEAFKDPNPQPVKIGVLKKNPTVCKGEFSFHLDLEDSNNDTKIISGSENPPGIKISKSGVTFTYCQLDIDGEYGSIPRVPYDYVVLRLSDNCPFGTYPFRRHHDTEDNSNNNHSSGYIGPNVINRNASLEYCFIPADKNSILEYPFEDDYGVFANISSETIIHSEIKLDDEDDGNANSWNWYSTPNDIQTRIKEIMNGGSNTIYHVASYIVIVWNAIFNFFFG